VSFLFVVGVVPPVIFGVLGILPIVLSLLMGPWAMEATGKPVDYKDTDKTLFEKIKDRTSSIMIVLLVTLGLILSIFRWNPGFDGALFGESKVRYKYSVEQKNVLAQSKKLSKIDIPYVEPAVPVAFQPLMMERTGDILGVETELTALPQFKLPKLNLTSSKDIIDIELNALPFDKQAAAIKPMRVSLLAVEEGRYDIKQKFYAVDNIRATNYAMGIMENIERKLFLYTIGKGAAISGLSAALDAIPEPVVSKIGSAALRVGESVYVMTTMYPDYVQYPWIKAHPFLLSGLIGTSSVTGIAITDIVRKARWDDIADVWDEFDKDTLGSKPNILRKYNLTDVPAERYKILSVGVTEVIYKRNYEYTGNPEKDAIFLNNYLTERLEFIEAMAEEHENLPIGMYRSAGSKILHKVRENPATIIMLMSLSYSSFIGVPGTSNPVVKTVLFSTGIGTTLLFALNIEKEKGTATDMFNAIKDRGIDREQFAKHMGLSYLNEYWDEGLVGGEESAIVQVFSDRFKEQWEKFEIDFSGYRVSAHKLKRKWDNLQTEYRIARDIWDAQFENGIVTCDRVNVRSAPILNGTIIRNIKKKGTIVKINQLHNSWVNVSIASMDLEGWIHQDCIRVIEQADAAEKPGDHEKDKDVKILEPKTKQLRDIAQIVEAVLQDVLAQDSGEYFVKGMDFEEFQKYYAHMLKQENVQLNDFVKKQEAKTADQISEADKKMAKVAKSRLQYSKDQQKIDKEARILYSYLWLKNMGKRFSIIINNIYKNKLLAKYPAQRKMIRDVAQERKPATDK